ncbi:MAG: CoA-transferase [Myxococcota bacterium]|jgi:glutaconate CoA-transferase subunit A|nr:CoA-transferase [Myxococcota bacterium]
MDPEEVVEELADGMTLGIGGWGSRRKPMTLVRAIARSPLKDLTVVSYGGPDVGILCALGKIRRLVFGFVSLDSIPLEPHFRTARQAGTIPEVVELDEGMLQLGLRAAAWGVPFLPTRAGLGSDVLRVNPELQTLRSPYSDEELVAVPALKLDVALVHMNRADERGNAQYLGPDPYFDDWFCMAAERAFVSCEKLGLDEQACLHTRLLNRTMVDGVIVAPGGAWFTECPPDYDRDEALQQRYAQTARDPEAWARFLEEEL